MIPNGNPTMRLLEYYNDQKHIYFPVIYIMFFLYVWLELMNFIRIFSAQIYREYLIKRISLKIAQSQQLMGPYPDWENLQPTGVQLPETLAPLGNRILSNVTLKPPAPSHHWCWRLKGEPSIGPPRETLHLSDSRCEFFPIGGPCRGNQRA